MTIIRFFFKQIDLQTFKLKVSTLIFISKCCFVSVCMFLFCLRFRESLGRLHELSSFTKTLLGIVFSGTRIGMGQMCF